MAALGLVNMVGADLGGAAHHDRIEPAQGLAQLLGGIKLLNNLVAIGAQLRQSGFVHPICYQNFHISFSCYFSIRPFSPEKRHKERVSSL